MDFPELAIEDKCVCPVKSCGSEFSSSSQLTMHILRHHKGCKLPVRSGEGSEHYCPVDNCSRAQGNGKPFPRLGQLKQHYHSVHGIKQYTCEVCGRVFGLKDVCNRHQIECGSHIQCVTCKETFRSKNALYQHTKRKNHQLPPGCKPRNKKRSESIPTVSSNNIVLCPIIVKSIPPHNTSSETAVQTDPLPTPSHFTHHNDPTPITTVSHFTQHTEPTVITTASQASHITHNTEAATQCPGQNLISKPLLASTATSTPQNESSSDLNIDMNTFVDASTQFISVDSSSMSEVLDASTNTGVLQYPLNYSSLEQLIDASTNTLSPDWADPLSRVDTGTSTMTSDLGDTMDLATQTNFDALVCDLATQTELPSINLQSHNFACYSSNDFASQSHDFASCFQMHDFAGGPDFDNFDFSTTTDSQSHTKNISTSTNISMSDYGVQTGSEFDEISRLLSDFGTQTIDPSGVMSIPQLSDFSMQTGLDGTDSYTQTSSLLSESGTQTLLDSCGFIDNFGTQT